MRMRPIEQILVGLARHPLQDRQPILAAQAAIERSRRLLWHGRPGRADEELIRLIRHAADVSLRNGGAHHDTELELRRHCADLRGYLGNNRDSIVAYHRRYDRLRPISTSRAEGCVDEIANARMGKRRKMRWSAKGANAVAVV